MIGNINLIYRPDNKCERIYLENHELLLPQDVIIHSFGLSEPFKLNVIKIEPLSVLFSAHTSIR